MKFLSEESGGNNKKIISFFLLLKDFISWNILSIFNCADDDIFLWFVSYVSVDGSGVSYLDVDGTGVSYLTDVDRTEVSDVNDCTVESEYNVIISLHCDGWLLGLSGSSCSVYIKENIKS